MYNVYRKACFSQKLFIKMLDMSLPAQALIEKTVHGVETHRFSGYGKGLITIYLFEKDATLNRTSLLATL